MGHKVTKHVAVPWTTLSTIHRYNIHYTQVHFQDRDSRGITFNDYGDAFRISQQFCLSFSFFGVSDFLGVPYGSAGTHRFCSGAIEIRL